MLKYPLEDLQPLLSPISGMYYVTCIEVPKNSRYATEQHQLKIFYDRLLAFNQISVPTYIKLKSFIETLLNDFK